MRTFKWGANDEIWSLSPYPDGRNFAFTIIHDADDSYSKRLAALFDTFDELGLKITVTAFVQHGNFEFETANQKYSECRFYKRLAASGHEIRMHTPQAQHLIRDHSLFKDLNRVQILSSPNC